MLHVACQGDQPISVGYFLKLGLDINSRDSTNCTPLHWAAVSDADSVLVYITAWGGHLDAVDIKGKTALHFLCKKHHELSNTKSIKHLLIKGANRNILDNDNKRPIDYVPTDKPSFVKGNAVEINNLLKDDEWSFAGDCLVLRTTTRKQEKKPWTQIAYFVLMSVTYCMQLQSTYSVFVFTSTRTV